jgi:hypothetical protein
VTENISSLPSKKSIITKKALIITGAVVGAFAAGYLLKKIGAGAVVEAIAE